MKLIAARCPNCGADIEVDKNSDSTKCDYCGKKIIVEDAVAKYKLELSGKVEFSNLTNFDKLYKLANRYYSDGNYSEACEKFNKALELNPDDPIVVLRAGLSSLLISSCEKKDVQNAFNSFKHFCSLVDEELDFDMNSYIYEVKTIIDVIVNKNRKSLLKTNMNYNMLNNLILSSNECLLFYEYLYKYAKDKNVYDQLFESIDKLINMMLFSYTYFNCGKRVNYVLDANLHKSLISKKEKYTTEYNRRHYDEDNFKPKKANNFSFSFSERGANILGYSFFGMFLVITISFLSNGLFVQSVIALLCSLVCFPIISSFFSKKIKQFFIIQIACVMFLMFILLLSFLEETMIYNYEWTNGTETIYITDEKMVIKNGEEVIFDGKYDIVYGDGYSIINTETRSFKYARKKKNVLFCEILSKENVSCIENYYSISEKNEYNYVKSEEELE